MNSLTLTTGKILVELSKEVPLEKLEKLLDIHGVARQFIAFSGDTIVTPLENRLHILAGLGIQPLSENDVDKLLEEAEEAPWQQWLEVVTFADSGSVSISLALSDSELDKTFTWQLEPEKGETLNGEFNPAELESHEEHTLSDRHFSRRRFMAGNLEAGYYTLRLSNGEKWINSLLIVAPPRCHEPPWLEQDERIWGISAQLYTLNEADNWGIGDFADLHTLIKKAADAGAAFILLNPLHALSNLHPQEASPYSPVDRRFLNPLYIRPQLVEEFHTAVDMDDYLHVIDEDLVDCRAERSVPYARVFALKYGAFQGMFQSFSHLHLPRKTLRAKAFKRFVKTGGQALLAFAHYQAQFAIPAVPASEQPEFHLYLQWIASLQLEQCQTLAQEAGMKIGLIRDLAVGGNVSSCEVTTNADLFCLESRIGAPPDYMNPDGQNWGLPPFRPDRLKQTRFSHFIQLLRTNMQSCGALRIDHVMALMRLWWCPSDGSNANGAYVHYQVEALFAILRLESQRAGCVVIGEDLGVVPPEIRPFLDGGGLLSNVLFYFEKYDGWYFRRPEHYKPRALAFIANHDVPPLKAWWNCRDIELRREIGLIRDDEQRDSELAFRLQEKTQILNLLREYGLLPEHWQHQDGAAPYDMALAAAIFSWCASSASQMLSVQLDDIAALETPINIPGTSAEYANWSRKIPCNMDALFSGKSTPALLDALRKDRS